MMERELPEGWVETSLGSLSTIQSGGTPSRNNSKYWGGDIPWIKISDLKGFTVDLAEEYITEEGLKNSSARIFNKGTILLTIFATIGKVSVLKIDATTNQAIAGITPYDKVNSTFITYALINLSNKLLEKSKGVAQKNINLSILKDTLIPLPPLAEQERIVAKLDAAFAHVETLKTSLARIPELLKKFRQTVLTQAVTGKLTEEWRIQSNYLNTYDNQFPKSWNIRSCKDLSESHILGKMLDKNKNKGEETLYLRNINVRWFNFDISDLQMLRINVAEKKKFSVEDGDLFICEGGEPGRAAIWRNGTNDLIFQKALHRIRFKKNIIPDIFLYNLKVDASSGKLNSFFTGTGILHLTSKSLSNYTIGIPPLEEQQEIVSRVEALFAKADAIEAQYQRLKEKIDRLPQALLAKAFRGELVPQDPNDEPASVLLEKIQSATEKLTKKSKKQMSLAFEA